MPGPPARTVRAVAEREHRRGAELVRLERRPLRAGEDRATSPAPRPRPRVRPTTVTRSRSVSAGDPVRGSMTWCASPCGVRQRRRSAPEVAIAPLVSSSVSVPRCVSTPTGHAPPRTARSPPALDEARPERREQIACAVDRVALPDAAEVEPDAGPEPDLPRLADDGHRPEAPGRRTASRRPSRRARPPRTSCRSRRPRAASCTVGSKRPRVRARAVERELRDTERGPGSRPRAGPRGSAPTARTRAGTGRGSPRAARTRPARRRTRPRSSRPPGRRARARRPFPSP